MLSPGYTLFPLERDCGSCHAAAVTLTTRDQPGVTVSSCATVYAGSENKGVCSEGNSAVSSCGYNNTHILDMPRLSHTWHIASNSGPAVSPPQSAWGAGTVARSCTFKIKACKWFFSSAAYFFGWDKCTCASLWSKVKTTAQESLLNSLGFQ